MKIFLKMFLLSILALLLLLAAFLFLFFLFIYVFYGYERKDPRVEKPLKIKMVHDNPCFYIEPFEDMDRFVIRNISVDHTISPLSYENQWHEGEFDTTSADSYNQPIGQRYLFPPSAISGQDSCVEYGTDLDKNASTVKKLKTRVIYSADCVGYNKKQWTSAKEKVGEIYFGTTFYIQKNSSTNKLEAIIVNDNNHTIQ
ncbi:MAG: hypothetical protein PHQ90_11395 [Sulfuricurvum sp.]|uniref:hypothetical protein n=1 Tax=Sulfuricurvum sp. TaxID=2025608 RepID=UPI00261DC350|nr:hypothetical protein [Sulfuricurvum sp.]MDD2369899.1 hypothetical protein [Sulfuricurvum sp.]MDD2950317.1 hypothetical protein [Sulfuricurvum sp.]MDD5118318.1 hypothetical protein [Sulfuricurvum sp.]